MEVGSVLCVPSICFPLASKPHSQGLDLNAWQNSNQQVFSTLRINSRSLNLLEVNFQIKILSHPATLGNTKIDEVKKFFSGSKYLSFAIRKQLAISHYALKLTFFQLVSCWMYVSGVEAKLVVPTNSFATESYKLFSLRISSYPSRLLFWGRKS